ncbi:O-acyltransferase like protein-like [Belonocnema kinseyi]|uniref:O-acyltransferase like protein-like n=1 Tax=Belonocnema kinseyi TaxID=2817044 RepID=UPI00143DA53D|nr:O-acyltransferase like protein-like [Belonocnema kinseyi]
MLFMQISKEKVGDLFILVFWVFFLFDEPWLAEGIETPTAEGILLKVFSRPFTPTENASEKCLKDSDIYLNSLNYYKPWALQMYDASAKPTSGLLTGNNVHLGNHDECLKIRTEYGFTGQACNAQVQIAIFQKEDNSINSTNLFIQLALASNITKFKGEKMIEYESIWCVPSSCNYTEVSQALDKRLDPLRIQDAANVTVKVNTVTCHSAKNDRVDFNIEDWIYIGIIILFLAIILASTTYDLIRARRSPQFEYRDTKHMLISSFSLYTNGKNLFLIERRESVIGCLDGLRFFSICWIIFGHTYYMEIAGVKLDFSHINTMHETWSNLFILNSNIVTDTFFLISAILLAYTVLTRNKKSPDVSLNLMHLYVHRYFRLTPAYAMTIGFYATLFYKMGSGLDWDTWVGKNSDYCRKNWWTNLLYINNYINLDAMCMSQSWYLAVDMQLIWISPIFLFPMLKLKKKVFFWIILVFGVTVSIIVPFVLTYYEKLPGTMLYYKGLADTEKVFVLIYVKTYARAGPYIMGLGLGYLLHKTHSFKITMSPSYVLSGWLLAAAVGLSAVLGARGLYYSYDRIEASFYAGLHRHAFALAISWIIFASTHGYAGLIGKFLSWRVWMPFSRLTYSAYLCHYIVLFYYSGTVRAAEKLTTVNVMRKYFGNLIMTLFISSIVCLCFEMPFFNLERALNRKKHNLNVKPSGPELYKSKSVGEIVNSFSQIGTDIEDISKGSVETICNSFGDVSFYGVQVKNTLRVSVYDELSKSQRDRECSTNGAKN